MEEALILSEMLIVLLCIVAGLALLAFWIIIPARMARKRGRSVFAWLVLTLFTSPILTIFILLLIGDSRNKVRDDICNAIRSSKSSDN